MQEAGREMMDRPATCTLGAPMALIERLPGGDMKLLLSVVLLAISPAALANDGKACELTSPEELQATIGAKVALKPSVLPNGVELCTGKAGLTTVTIRLY